VNLPTLNFPIYEFRTQTAEHKTLVFDIVRKKFVTLTPEEWVRQHVIQFLIQEHKVSVNKISIEYFLKWNEMQHRCDIVVFDDNFKPVLIVECKEARIPISQNVFDQVARYNITLKVPYLMVTNGLQHIYAHINFELNNYTFIETLSRKL
jgi:hypothetical protein